MRALELKIPPVVLWLGLGAMMTATARLASLSNFTFSASTLPARWILATGLALAGLVIAALGVASFRRAGTTVHPMHPENAARLVVSGVYRRTRNPMYLGMWLVLLGWGVFLGHALALVLAAGFVPLMNRLQIGPEERVLSARFGAEYVAYRSAVRRWL